jgi:hypothetical protein
MEKPRLKLVGEDGNAFSILGRARQAARAAGWSDAEWSAFRTQATAGDYDNLLRACLEHFDCEADHGSR